MARSAPLGDFREMARLPLVDVSARLASPLHRPDCPECRSPSTGSEDVFHQLSFRPIVDLAQDSRRQSSIVRFKVPWMPLRASAPQNHDPEHRGVIPSVTVDADEARGMPEAEPRFLKERGYPPEEALGYVLQPSGLDIGFGPLAEVLKPIGGIAPVGHEHGQPESDAAGYLRHDGPSVRGARRDLAAEIEVGECNPSPVVLDLPADDLIGKIRVLRYGCCFWIGVYRNEIAARQGSAGCGQFLGGSAGQEKNATPNTSAFQVPVQIAAD